MNFKMDIPQFAINKFHLSFNFSESKHSSNPEKNRSYKKSQIKRIDFYFLNAMSKSNSILLCIKQFLEAHGSNRNSFCSLLNPADLWKKSICDN